MKPCNRAPAGSARLCAQDDDTGTAEFRQWFQELLHRFTSTVISLSFPMLFTEEAKLFYDGFITFNN
jgi:hypothetical protein